MSTASKVAQSKRNYPETFCPEPRCLWRTGGGYCPRHEDLAVMRAKLRDPKAEREAEYDLITQHWPERSDTDGLNNV